MITSLLPSHLRPRHAAAYLTALIGAASLASFSTTQAAVPTVVSGDTFNIELLAYDSAAPKGDFYAIQTNLQPAFVSGTSQTFSGDTLDGEDLTISYLETVTGSTFTDTITLSTPTTFLPAGTTDSNGNVVDSLEFAIGNYIEPKGGTDNALNYMSSLPDLSGLTITGTVSGSFGTFPITTSQITSKEGPANKALSSVYSVSTNNGTDIGALNVNSFTLTITNAVPEPTTTGAVLLGAGGLVGFMVVRRRSRARLISTDSTTKQPFCTARASICDAGPFFFLPGAPPHPRPCPPPIAL